MRSFVYKRTHKGDPDRRGGFGIRDCMGKLRNLDFDSVIGIGGLGSAARDAGIAGKLNWIGVGARKQEFGLRSPLVTFKHFILFDGKGKEFEELAPALAKRMYSRHAPRFLLNDFDRVERAEIRSILKIARTAGSSKAILRPTRERCCTRKHR
jgi:hypothetical protein